MSEELKCPCCGGIIANINNIKCCCECNFECDNKDLPRIAAAMELAKSTMLFEKSKTTPSFLDYARGEIKKAEQRVLEVFGK